MWTSVAGEIDCCEVRYDRKTEKLKLRIVEPPREKKAQPKVAPRKPCLLYTSAQAVSEAKAGKIEYRLDKTNIIHCPIGKVSFGADKLVENYNTLIGAIVRAKPAAAKGQYIRSCVTASTMGPGVKINANKQM